VIQVHNLLGAAQKGSVCVQRDLYLVISEEYKAGKQLTYGKGLRDGWKAVSFSSSLAIPDRF